MSSEGPSSCLAPASKAADFSSRTSRMLSFLISFPFKFSVYSFFLSASLLSSLSSYWVGIWKDPLLTVGGLPFSNFLKKRALHFLRT